MPQPEETHLEVRLDLQSRLIDECTEWEIDSDFLSTTDTFSFTCYSSEDRAKISGLELQPVTLYLRGDEQLIGRIDSSRVGDNGTAITYKGRDYLADMVTCSVDPTVTIKEGTDLAGAITQVASTVGIDTVFSDGDLALRNIRSGRSISGRAGPSFQALKAEDIKPNYGESQFGFLSRIVARHGATIQPANDRRAVMLAAPNYDQSAAYSLQRTLRGDKDDNVISGVANRDFSNFPTFTLFNGSQARSAEPVTPTSAAIAAGRRVAFMLASATIPGATIPPGSISDNLFGESAQTREPKIGTVREFNTAGVGAGFAPAAEDIILGACHVGRRKPSEGTGDPLKLYRLFAVRDDRSKNQAQLERLAVRQVGERLKETLVYTCTVKGHVDPKSGAIWSVDTIADVVDEVCDISEPMWIASRVLKYSESAGATTTLTLWRPGAFLT